MDANNDFKGLWIPFQILTDKNLSDKEKFILCLILYKSKISGNCCLSNKYLSNIFNISETQVSKIIKNIIKIINIIQTVVILTLENMTLIF